mmetsp:Transcript_4885/g.13695  ORF Transcript_4885/g.13695 Transcript_4885/m.13695 type:complete len:82 (-) Transcript_4885:84-329(-)
MCARIAVLPSLPPVSHSNEHRQVVNRPHSGLPDGYVDCQGNRRKKWVVGGIGAMGVAEKSRGEAGSESRLGEWRGKISKVE